LRRRQRVYAKSCARQRTTSTFMRQAGYRRCRTAAAMWNRFGEKHGSFADDHSTL